VSGIRKIRDFDEKVLATFRKYSKIQTGGLKSRSKKEIVMKRVSLSLSLSLPLTVFASGPSESKSPCQQSSCHHQSFDNIPTEAGFYTVTEEYIASGNGEQMLLELTVNRTGLLSINEYMVAVTIPIVLGLAVGSSAIVNTPCTHLNWGSQFANANKEEYPSWSFTFPAKLVPENKNYVRYVKRRDQFDARFFTALNAPPSGSTLILARQKHKIMYSGHQEITGSTTASL
jgi:hypothetical protein